MAHLTEARLARALISAVVIVAVISIVALGLGLVAQSRAAKVAAAQAAQADKQSQQLRDSICGTFLTVSRTPITEKTTELGRTLVRETGKGARVAQCPDAPLPVKP
jgi:archaellin